MVQEVTVLTNGIPAKYGNTGGGVVIQATRSGTNEYHGSFSWRHTDPGLNALPVGQTIPNAMHQNFFGGYLGGPVTLPKIYNGRNRTFVFGGFEPARLLAFVTAKDFRIGDDDNLGPIRNKTARQRAEMNRGQIVRLSSQPKFLPNLREPLLLAVVIAKDVDGIILPEPAVKLVEELAALRLCDLRLRQFVRERAEDVESG